MKKLILFLLPLLGFGQSHELTIRGLNYLYTPLVNGYKIEVIRDFAFQSSQQQILISEHIAGGGGGSSALIAKTCQNLGTNGGTTSGIDTTGANFIATDSSYGGTAISGPVVLAITDNKGNGSPTALTEYVNTITGLRMHYWTNASTGSGHTFTASEVSVNTFNSLCAEAWSNMATSSVFDSGTDSGTAPAPANSCAPGSITPSAGVKVVISGVSTDVTASAISASFTIDATVVDAGAGGWGDAVASLLQSPNGATVNPSWTITGSGRDACNIAAFKGM